MAKARWHRITTLQTHVGAGKNYPKYIYMFVENATHALNKYKGMGGIKRDSTPDIDPVKKDEVANLESEIKREIKKRELAWIFGIKLRNIRRNFYYITNSEYGVE